jgi:transposase
MQEMNRSNELPQEIGTAHEVILVQSSTITKLDGEVKSLKHEVEELRAELRFLRSGQKREKFISKDQGLLEFKDDEELQANLEGARKEAEAEIERITYTRKKQRKAKPLAAESFPAELPREEVEVAIPEPYQSRVQSGELFVKRYEFTETLKTIPAKLVVLRYKKPVLAYSLSPERELSVEEEGNLGEQGRYHPSVGAQVVHGKFALHLPLYRQQDVFASLGWVPSRSSLDYVTDLVNDTTQGLTTLMRECLLGACCIGMDDTHTTLLMPKELPQQADSAFDAKLQRLIDKMRQAKKDKKESLDAKLWGYSSFDERFPYDIFDFRVSRHRDGPAEFLRNYAGHVMADCYSGNQSVVLAPGSRMIRMACWSHARRHVYTHQHDDPSVSVLPLALMNGLYDIERRGVNLTAQARGELRAKESKGLLDRLQSFLAGPVAGSVLPASKLGGALQYLRNHWQALTAYVQDGGLPIDNNQVERLMNRVAVGRKNWLFVGSVRAGERNANLMTLVASAQRQHLDLSAYLESVITHMLRGTAKPEELLPEVWKQHHPESVRVYREQERRDKADSASLQAARRRVASNPT